MPTGVVAAVSKRWAEVVDAFKFFGWFAGFVEETVEISIFRSTVRVKHVRAVILTWQ